MMETPTKAKQAYYALNQAVNNFSCVRTDVIIGQEKRRKRIAKYARELKSAAENFLQVYAEEYGNDD